MRRTFILVAGILAVAQSVFAESWTDPATGISWGYLTIGDTIEIARVIQDGDDESRAIPLTTTGAVIIPSTIHGMPVTRIGVSAFRDCDQLTSVTIPEGVIRIGDKAFKGCTALSIVEIPSSLTSIGFSAFEDCQSLTTISVPDALSHVGEAAFRGCAGLRRNGLVIINGVLYDGTDCSGDLVVPYGVTSIGYGAFSSYPYSGGNYVSSQITSVTLPSTVTNISDAAFFCCNNLKAVSISPNVTSIGVYAFYGCDELDGVTIPNNVTSIGYKAFYACSSLTNVTILSDMTSIGDEAFSSCEKLAKVEIPPSVTNIGLRAFRWCEALRRDGMVIVNNVLFDVRDRSGELSIPSGVTTISEFAMLGRNNLTSVYIPDSVKSIGPKAFAGSDGLSSVTMSAMVENIDELAFAGCDNLKKNGMTIINGMLMECSGLVGDVVIPSGVTRICRGVFSYDFYWDACLGNPDRVSKVTSITIPASVERIDTSFDDCTALTEFKVPEENPCFCSVNGVLFNKTRTKLIAYPRSREGGYKIPEGVIEIGDNAFSGCEGLTTIVIPSTVRKIGDAAFRNCKGLSSATIPQGVETIGDESFENCTKVSSVVIPSSARNVGESAFACCRGLSSVIIPEGVARLGRWTFDGCDNLSYVKLPSTLAIVEGGNPFSECFMVKEVHVSAGDADRIKTLIDASYTAAGDDEAWPLTCSYIEGSDISSAVVVLTNIVEEIVFVTNVVEQVREVEKIVTVYVTNQVDVVVTNYVGVADSDYTVVSEEIRSFEPNEEYSGIQKNTFSGVVFDAATNLAGLVQLTLAKATTKGVRVSGYIILADGKKQTLKSAYGVLEEGLLYLRTTIGKIGTAEILIGSDGFRGVIGEYTIVSAKMTEDAGVVKGSLTLTYFDPKTGKQKTRRITVNGTTADGFASGILTEKGKNNKTFVTEVELEQ